MRPPKVRKLPKRPTVTVTHTGGSLEISVGPTPAPVLPFPVKKS